MAQTSDDLLTGDLRKNLLKISIPTMFGFVLQAVYDIVDMIWIGRISSSAMAGVTIFSTVFWIVTVLNEIIGSSSISLISQSYGSGDNERTVRVEVLKAALDYGYMRIFLDPLFMFSHFPGTNIPFLLSSLISRWGIQIPLLFIVVRVLHLSVLYVWGSFVVADANSIYLL